ncbi:hypothetical protein Tco_0178306 [Tanacetum coccineum]
MPNVRESADARIPLLFRMRVRNTFRALVPREPLRGSILVGFFPSGNRNKTFDPGISIEVQSKRFLSLNEFSFSFISDPLSPVLETLLPFSSKNEDKVFNPGILVSKEEKSPHLLSHRGFKKLFQEHS